MRLAITVQLAEIVSAIAVVITLVILIYEVRENTASSRAVAYGQELERLNTVRYEMVRNREVAELFERYRLRELDLADGIEHMQLMQLLSAQ